MKDLVADMVNDVPAERPTMNQVVARFRKICSSLHWWTLRRPIDRRSYPSVIRFIRMLPTAFHTIRYISTRISAIPTCPGFHSIA